MQSDRYSRQIILPQVGSVGQEKLKITKVLCVGAGGLGSSALLYLTAAGIGNIAISDPDRVSLSNLQRQILYQEEDIGKIKSDTAVMRLHQKNSDIFLENIPDPITQNNVLALVKKYDYILDATDNLNTKILLNDICYFLQKPLISASINQFQGQISVFCYPGGPCWRCLYPQIQEMDQPNCAQAGVLGMIPGWFGIMQAMEVVKLSLNLPNPLVGQLIYWDILQGTPQCYRLDRNPNCNLCTGNNSYAMIEKQKGNSKEIGVKSDQITVQELNERITQKQDIFILDVRSPEEYQKTNMSGYLIPLPELAQRLDELPHDKPIVIHCRLGRRSQVALELLQQAGFTNVQSLIGGIEEWQREIVEKGSLK